MRGHLPITASRLTWRVGRVGGSLGMHLAKPFGERQNNFYVSNAKGLSKGRADIQVQGEPEVAAD